MALLLSFSSVLAACRSDRQVPVPAPAPVPTAFPVDAAALVPMAVDAAMPIAPAWELPPSDRLVAPFRGTNAHGFVAMTSMTSRSFVTMPRNGDINADKPVLIASFTKLFTAVAALRMVERSELSLDETIKTALPDLASRPWSDSTIRELLTHTSRVPEFDEKGAQYYKRSDVDLSSPIPVIVKYVPADWTEKRGVYKYRNSELAIVGAILATRAKVSAADVLANEVFVPANMKHSGLFIKQAPAGLDLATMGSIRAPNFFTAGAGYSTANDLLAFFEALASNILLKDTSKTLLFDGSPERNYGAIACWSFPFAKSEGGSTRLVERPGTFGNVRLFTAYFPDEQRAIIAWTDNVDIPRPRAGKGIGWSLAHIAIE